MVDYWNQIWVLAGASDIFVYRENGNGLDGLSIDINRGNELTANQVYDIFEDEKGFVIDKLPKLLSPIARPYTRQEFR